MIGAAINVSEGRDPSRLDALRRAAGASLLDVHADAEYNRAVLTLAGPTVLDDAVALAGTACEILDIRRHDGAHPRLGVVDVVPFTPVGAAGFAPPLDLSEALAARDEFARTVATRLAVPCFLYGPERTLPEIRHTAFRSLDPDVGPVTPHETAGACCVGARGALIAYNLHVTGLDRDAARAVAREVRAPELRTLSFAMPSGTQISCNLVDPARLGIADVYAAVAAACRRRGGAVDRAELVGLAPAAALDGIDTAEYARLGLSERSTIERRLSTRR